MAKDDEEARKKRAEELRKQIEELKSGAPRPAGGEKSPREFVEEKMREKEGPKDPRP